VLNVERHLELLGDLLASGDEALVEDADGGDVGHRLGESLVGSGQAGGLVGEQVEGAQALVAKSHRYAVGGGEAGLQGGGGEVRPASGGAGQVVLGDGLTAAPAVQARAVFVLHFEQLDEMHSFARRSHCLQLPAGVNQYQASLGHAEHLDAQRQGRPPPLLC
jgi:hypothetical protein